jgi:predicted RNA-binding protein with PIN domain
MEKLVQEIDTMREEFKQQERKQAHDKWQARVEELQQIRAEELQQIRAEEPQPEAVEE